MFEPPPDLDASTLSGGFVRGRSLCGVCVAGGGYAEAGGYTLYVCDFNKDRLHVFGPPASPMPPAPMEGAAIAEGGEGRPGDGASSSPASASASAVAAAASAPPRAPLLVLYGTVSGNSLAVARHVRALAASHGFAAQIHPLDEFRQVVPRFAELGWSCTPRLIVVTSSTGNGSPPHNGEKFDEYLHAAARPAPAAPAAPTGAFAAAGAFAGVGYAVVALGHSRCEA